VIGAEVTAWHDASP